MLNPPKEQKPIKLGSLTGSYDHIAIQIATLKLPLGIDSKKFSYKIPNYDPETLKKLSELIQTKISKTSELKTVFAEKKPINVFLHSDGTCQISYKDAQGTKHQATLFEKNNIAQALFETAEKRQQLEKSLPILKRAVHKKKSKSPQKVKSEKHTGEYHPVYILHQRWSQLFNRIKELTKEKTSSQLSKESAASLKFFALQYLQRVASISQETSIYGGQGVTKNDVELLLNTSVSPLAGVRPSYYRSYDPASSVLKLLNNHLKKKFSMEDNFIMSVSDADRFVNVITSQPDKICHLSFDDNEATLEKKISDILKKIPLSSPVKLLFDLPDLTQIPKDGLARFDSLVNKIVSQVKAKELQADVACSLLGVNKKNPPQDFIWLSKTIEDPSPIVQLCVRHGFTPTMQQTARTLSKDMPLEEFPKEFNLVQNYGLRLGSLVVSDFKEFLENPTFRQFQKYAKNSPFSDFKLLAENMCQYIKGFEKYPLDDIFAKKGMGTFLKETYAQILNFMEVLMALDYNDPKAKYKLTDFTTLIFENLNFWLEISVNEQAAKDKVNSLLKEKVLPNTAIRPAVVSMVNTGLKCIAAITQACQASKQGSQKINVMSFQDSYYELVAGLETAGAYVAKAPNYEQSMQEHFTKLKQNSEKLDVLFVDPNGSIQAGTPFVTTHNIEAIIESAISQGVTNKPFTIAMDVTLGKIDDKQLTALINKYQKQITAGDLNFVCYRSIQKLDQFGLDKISGGYLQVFSNNPSYIEKFASTTKAEERDIDPINLKALSHLYENCLPGLDQYRSAEFANANYVYDHIDKAIHAEAKTEGLPFYLDERRDVESPFICLRFKGRGIRSNVMALLDKLNEFGLPTRLSYGFAYSTYSGIPVNDQEFVLRVTFGLEEKSKLDMLINTINNFSKDVTKKLDKALVETLDKELDNTINKLFQGSEKKGAEFDKNVNFLRELITKDCNSQDYVERTKQALQTPEMKEWLKLVLTKPNQKDILNYQDELTWNSILDLNHFKLLSPHSWETISMSRTDFNEVAQALSMLEKKYPSLLKYKEAILQSYSPLDIAGGLIKLTQEKLLEKPLVQQFLKDYVKELSERATDFFVKVYALQLEGSKEIIELAKEKWLNCDAPEIVYNIFPHLSEINMKDDATFGNKLLNRNLEDATRIFYAYKELTKLHLENNPDLRKIIFEKFDRPMKFAQELSSLINNLIEAGKFHLEKEPIVIDLATSSDFNKALEFVKSLKQANINIDKSIHDFVVHMRQGYGGYSEAGNYFSEAHGDCILKLIKAKVPITEEILKPLQEEYSQLDEKAQKIIDDFQQKQAATARPQQQLSDGALLGKQGLFQPARRPEPTLDPKVQVAQDQSTKPPKGL